MAPENGEKAAPERYVGSLLLPLVILMLAGVCTKQTPASIKMTSGNSRLPT